MRRGERGSSFCDIISSSKSSIRGGSHSSLILEDDGSSSDAGASSSDEFGNGGRATRRLNRSADDHDCDDDDDLEQKIKFFFQRIEQQEIVGEATFTSIQVHDVDSDMIFTGTAASKKDCSLLNDSIDHSFIMSTTTEASALKKGSIQN